MHYQEDMANAFKCTQVDGYRIDGQWTVEVVSRYHHISTTKFISLKPALIEAVTARDAL